MKNDLVIKKCQQCGAEVMVLKDCDCNDCFKCCGEEMIVEGANSVDASFEKHIPVYEVVNGELVVKVNHVMEADHFIEWICLVSDDKKEFISFKPGVDAIVRFKAVESGKLYAHCNKHGLWMKEIEK